MTVLVETEQNQQTTTVLCKTVTLTLHTGSYSSNAMHDYDLYTYGQINRKRYEETRSATPRPGEISSLNIVLECVTKKESKWETKWYKTKQKCQRIKVVFVFCTTPRRTSSTSVACKLAHQAFWSEWDQEQLCMCVCVTTLNQSLISLGIRFVHSCR